MRTVDSQQARNINILQTAIKEIIEEIRSLIETLEKTNAKSIARFLFIPLNNNQANRNLYLSWVKGCYKGSLSGKKINNIWIPLCDSVSTNDAIKKIIKKL